MKFFRHLHSARLLGVGLLFLLAGCEFSPGRMILDTKDVDEARQFQRTCLNRGRSWVTGITPLPRGLERAPRWRVTCWQLEP